MAAERLQKVLAAAGVASRRASEALIAAGRVTVDGQVAHLGDQADPELARIEVDGRVIGSSAAPIHLALHKPAGVTSTVRDPHAERTVLQLLPTALLASGSRLYPVGRLDRDSEGLLLLTNDGPWAEHVLHPRFGIDREYAVGLRDWLSNDQRRTLDGGIDLDEGRAVFAHPVRPASAAETLRMAELLAPPVRELVWYRVVLRQGWKRQVRRMFGAVGAPIARLVRVRIGPVRLDRLPSGRYRRLRGPELQALAGPRGGAPAAGKSRRRGPDRAGAAGSNRPRAAGSNRPRPAGPDRPRPAGQDAAGPAGPPDGPASAARRPERTGRLA
jgi:23S rRNA pseudouridine2605 synthase